MSAIEMVLMLDKVFFFFETFARLTDPEKYEKGTDNWAKHKKQSHQREYPACLNMVMLSNPAHPGTPSSSSASCCLYWLKSPINR